VHDPELLFLDEPTNGLDPRARDEMLALIMDLPKKRSCSILISTHLLPDVDRICDQVMIMQSGALRFSGSIEALRRSGQGESERVLEVEMRDPIALFAEHLRAADCQVEARDGMRLVVTMPEGRDSAFLLRQARAVGAQVRGMKPKLETLEDAFLRVVGSELEQSTPSEGTAAPSGEQEHPA